MSEVITVQDLETLKKHEIFEAEVITGKVGGLTGGVDIPSATNSVTGQTQKTLPKVISDAEAEFDAQIINMGFTRVGTFALGATLTNPRQTLLWETSAGGDGQEYGWSGTFPKVVPPASTPLTTGGIAVGAWISRFDPELRIIVRDVISRSYAEAGYNLVAGSFEVGGVLTSSTDVLLYEANGKAYSGNGPYPQTVVAGSTPGAGFTDRSGLILRGQIALQAANVQDLLTGKTLSGAVVPLQIGQRWSTGGTNWKVVSTAMPTTMANFNNISNIYAADFGLTGNTDRSAWLYVSDRLVELGSKNIHLVFTDKITYTGGLGSCITLSNLDHFVVSGLVLEDVSTYVGYFDVTRLFDITDTKIVSISCDVTSTLASLTDDAVKQGMSVCRFYRGDKFTFNGRVDKCYQSFEVSGVKHNTSNVVAKDTRYPNHFAIGNGIININADCNGCRRDFFILNGCTGGKIVINSVDQAGVALLKHYVDDANQSPEMSNMDIDIKVRDTGRYLSIRDARQAYIGMEIDRTSTTVATTTPAKYSNIDIKLDIADGAGYGSVLGLRKSIDDTIGDTVGRGYVLQNVTVRGRVELSNATQCVFFNYRDTANWVAGDTIAGMRIADLTLLDRAPVDVVFNLEMIIGAVDVNSPVVCDNFNAQSVKLATSVDFSGKVQFKNSRLFNYTSKGADLNSPATLRRGGWFSGINNVFKIGTVVNYRTLTSVDIQLTANTPSSAMTGLIAGRFVGNILYATTPPGTAASVKWLTDHSSGTAVTPTLTINDAGEVFVNLPEWVGLDIYMQINVEFRYNQYSNALNKTASGLVYDVVSIL